MTQQDQILHMLRTQEWVSTVDFVNAYILRGGARIYDLRKSGYKIESRKVKRAGETKPYEEYRLISEPNAYVPKLAPGTNQYQLV